MINQRSMRAGRRDGVALVMVIGFLAVLVLLAVGFAVSMRIERIAASNYADTIRARQLVYAAVSEAQAKIDSLMGNQAYPTFPGYASASGSRNLITGSATNYIPRGVLQSATTSLGVNWTDWQVTGPTGTVTVGRYAFAAVDCSGFIDVNLDGTTTVSPSLPVAPGRGLGYSTRELYLDNQLLPELVAGSEANVKSGRLTGSNGENTPWVRMESVAEINPILGYYGSGSPMLPGVAPSNLFVYSRAPAGYVKNGTTMQAVYLGTNDTELAQQKSAILTALQNMGGVYDPSTLMVELLDYADSDSIPGSLTIPSIEPIPMINEVVVSSRVYTASGTTHVTNQLIVELWFPFTGITNNVNYSLNVLAPIPAPSGASVESLPPGPNTVTLSGPWISGYTTVVLPLPCFQWSTGTVNWSSTIVRPALTMRELGSGSLVDQVAGANTLTIPFGSLLGSLSVGANGNYFLGCAVDDPRLNWDGSAGGGQWRQMPNNTHSLKAFNTGYCNALAAGKDFGGSSVTSIALYVANQPYRTAGELGLLMNYNSANPAGSAWTSIRLINSTPSANDALPVLDVFTTLPTGTVARGRINLNSPHPGPLATAFNKAYMDAYPNEPGAQQPTPAELATLALQLKATGPFLNVSEIAKLGDANVPGATPVKKEGLVRNTANLLTARQNIFTVIVAAQTCVPGKTGAMQDSDVTAEQRGIAVIWRDPYPNANGGHDSFVRFFRWLTD